MTRRHRILSATFAAAATATATVAVAVAGAAPSHANRPGPKLPGDVPGPLFAFVAGEVCPFAVSISVKDAHNWVREEAPGVRRGSGRLVVTFTNEDDPSRKPVDRNISGPGTMTFDAAGNLTAIDLYGASLGWQTEGKDLTGTLDDPVLYVSHGQFHYDGNLQLVRYHGSIENMCDVLG